MKQKQALDLLKTGRNIFITGPAGSGKTHLVNSYIAYLKQNNIEVGVTASTGIAATHMGGMTIHSWAGIGINTYLSESDLEAMAEKSYLAKRFEKVKVLIIDEVSMLHHFRLDLIDRVLRAMKLPNEPFGGVQVVLVGDFFQLPPVARFGEPPAQFIYHSDAWHAASFTICYLEEQFRQNDDVALSILNEIRAGDISKKTRTLLASRVKAKSTVAAEPTRLFTHNEDVDAINQAELERLATVEEAEYEMTWRGKEFIVETLKKSCLAHEKLRLKVGARVMCVKNNFDQGYVNGTLGTVVSCKGGQDPVILLANGKRITIEKASWKIEEDNMVKAELTQYPLRLAWAITVHKSQGMSLDAIEVDLSRSFEPGMGYVALSRVRTLDGLTILGMNEKALEVNQEVLEFDEQLRAASMEAEALHAKLETKSLKQDQEEFLELSKPAHKKVKLPSHEETALLIADRKSLDEIARERGVTKETIVDHIERLQEEESRVDIQYLRKEISRTHWMKINKAFDEILEESDIILLSAAKQKLGPNISYFKIRLARALKGLKGK